MAKRMFNFSKMNLAELVQLRDEIETALSGRIVIEREELRAKIADLASLERRRAKNGSENGAAANGFKRQQSRGRSLKAHPLKGRKAKPKYRGPNGHTWAGRGFAPKWLTDLEKKGKKREQFLVKTE